MADNASGCPETTERFISLDDGEMYVVEDGDPRAPAVLLVSNAAVPVGLWDPIVPRLAAAYRIIRADLLGHGRASAAGGYDIPTHARQVGAVLDRLGVDEVALVGHSSGCTVVAALAEQRPGTTAGLALMDMGPTPDAKIPEPLLTRLLVTRFPGNLLWRLRTPDTIHKAARNGFTDPAAIPDALVEHLLGMTHRAMIGAMRAPLHYLAERSLPDRLVALGLPVRVIFGAEDQRWRPASSAAYRAVPGADVQMLPGVGHMPMVDDPHTTATLLLDFLATTCCATDFTDPRAMGD